MRIYSKNRSSAIRKAIAWVLIPLLAACGNGTGNSPNSINTPGNGANLAATTTAVAVVTPASYTVANMEEGFDIHIRDNRVLNEHGQVAGFKRIPGSGIAHAFLYNGTTTKDLGALGSPNNASYATSINASGLVAGYSEIGMTTHAFLHNGTTMTDLGALGGLSARSEASAINASGQVVGKSFTTNNVEHAFIKSPGDSKMIDLNDRLTNAPGVELLDAVAISDSGYILAQANTGWVLLKPAAAVPTPAAATLGAITANDPVAVGTPVNVSMQFSDINTADTHTAVWTWESNGTSAGVVTEPNGTVPGTVTGSTIFLPPASITSPSA